jgi:hypothetical protein
MCFAVAITMKQSSNRQTCSTSAPELASTTVRLLAPGELATARGGFGGGLSRENFTVNAPAAVSSAP